MPSVPSLWKITVTCAPGLAGAVEAALAEGAVAVTVLAPPRKATAVVEALYDAKPGKAALNALRVKLAVMAALNKMDSPSPAKTKALRCNAKFSLPLPLSGEREMLGFCGCEAAHLQAFTGALVSHDGGEKFI
jgi:hypothetical protein